MATNNYDVNMAIQNAYQAGLQQNAYQNNLTTSANSGWTISTGTTTATNAANIYATNNIGSSSTFTNGSWDVNSYQQFRAEPKPKLTKLQQAIEDAVNQLK